MMGFRDWFDDVLDGAGRLFRRDGEEMFLQWLQDEPPPAGESGHTLQVRLTDMHLGRSRDWARDRLPVLYSKITTPSGVDVPMTVSPDAFERIGDGGQFRWSEQHNMPLSGSLPWNVAAGDLRLTVGLVYVKGDGVLSQAASFIGSLSKLVQIPHLSTASDIANKVSAGAENLIGVADPKGRVGLDVGIGWNDLRKGYLLAAGADEGTIRREDLAIDQENHRLLHAGTAASGLKTLDYFLLEVRVLENSGDQWTLIPTIAGPFKASILALQPDSLEKSKALLIAAITAAGTCPDLTLGEQERVLLELRERWEARRDAVFAPLGGTGPVTELDHVLNFA